MSGVTILPIIITLMAKPKIDPEVIRCFGIRHMLELRISNRHMMWWPPRSERNLTLILLLFGYMPTLTLLVPPSKLTI